MDEKKIHIHKKEEQRKKSKKSFHHLVCHDPSPYLLKDMDLLDAATGKIRDTGPPRATKGK
jgi:hypothetical protein